MAGLIHPTSLERWQEWQSTRNRARQVKHAVTSAVRRRIGPSWYCTAAMSSITANAATAAQRDSLISSAMEVTVITGPAQSQLL